MSETHNIDTADFLRRNFRDVAGVHAFLQEKGVTPLPNVGAIAKWFQRGSVPGKYMYVMARKDAVNTNDPV